MPYFYKAFGQNMLCKTPDELPMAELHAFLLPPLPIIFISKGGLLLLNSLNPMVADGYLVGISTQIHRQTFRLML